MKSKDSNFKKSVSYEKKDGRGDAHPSFWYDNDKDLKVCFLVTHVTCEIIVQVEIRVLEVYLISI